MSGAGTSAEVVAVPKASSSRRILIRKMAEQAAQIREHLNAEPRELRESTAASLSENLSRDVPGEEAADAIAQAIVCAAPIISVAPHRYRSIRGWLFGQLAGWERLALEKAEALSTAYSVPSTESPAHWYDNFLHHHSPTGRRRAGVFFTPQPIADYIVSHVDSLLREDCGEPAGFSADEVLVVDPACGTGVFLITILDYVHRGLMAAEEQTASAHWNDLVPRLLSRLIGIEILPAAALIAKLNIALTLAETGYDFSSGGDIRIITANALAADTESKIQNRKSKIPVVLGNPPFSSLSTTTNDWIARLVRGDDEIRGYIRANGQSLGERKTWLHDDYVKFIRLAQWHVENAGAGIVGFVTNHGYLDNATFRLMRHELLRVFPRIAIIDLHGNRKKYEVAPDGQRDENVFGLDQGVAIGLFCRPPARKGTGNRRQETRDQPAAGVQYAELWGTAAEKLRVLADTGSCRSVPCPLSPVSFFPSTPEWRLVPVLHQLRHAEYDSAWSLADAMPLNATAPVTARDHFVVGFTREELRDRIQQFRDLSINDDDIRKRFFQRTRSARYQTGDSRGWKLAEARRIVAADDNWEEKITRCFYRPFDWRYVFWHPAMIDWPRNSVTKHLVEAQYKDGETEGRREGAIGAGSASLSPSVSPSLRLALIARRQQLPTQPCTFFWITDCLALDGVIRSDNRGSESLFPLCVRQTDGSWRANFADAFINQFGKTTLLTWLPLGRGDLLRTFGPEDVLAYIYALFHCPSYRARYAEELRCDFPRLLPPTNTRGFEQMCRSGHKLIEFHTLRTLDAAHHQTALAAVPSTQYSVLSTPSASEPPVFADQPTPHSALRIPHLSSSVASFRAGGYLPLRKWLQPPHRSTSDPQYAQIVAAIARTVEIMDEIDCCVTDAGGFAS